MSKISSYALLKKNYHKDIFIEMDYTQNQVMNQDHQSLGRVEQSAFPGCHSY